MPFEPFGQPPCFGGGKFQLTTRNLAKFPVSREFARGDGLADDCVVSHYTSLTFPRIFVMDKAAVDVAGTLAGLSELTLFELRGAWRRLHRAPPPMRRARHLSF